MSSCIVIANKTPVTDAHFPASGSSLILPKDGSDLPDPLSLLTSNLATLDINEPSTSTEPQVSPIYLAGDILCNLSQTSLSHCLILQPYHQKFSSLSSIMVQFLPMLSRQWRLALDYLPRNCGMLLELIFLPWLTDLSSSKPSIFCLRLILIVSSISWQVRKRRRLRVIRRRLWDLERDLSSLGRRL